VATSAVANEALAIWSSEAADENQKIKKICITAAKTGFLLLQSLYGRISATLDAYSIVETASKVAEIV